MPSYHHGDLRRALVNAGLQLLEEGGPEALTVRAAARTAGVSRTAPYRHFRDRRALIAAVAEQCFGRMGEEIARAVQEGAQGLPALRRGLQAYAAFAQRNPAQYRVMFGSELSDREGLPALEGAALGVFGLLREGMVRMQESGAVGAGDPGLMATTAWATMHGVVMLALDGQAAATGERIETLVDAAIDLVVRGMAR